MLEGCLRLSGPELPKRKHLAGVDRDHQHFQYRASIGAARIGAPLAWQAHAIGLRMFQQHDEFWEQSSSLSPASSVTPLQV
jgi:hypothetical protein